MNILMLAPFSNCDSLPKVHHENVFFDQFLKGKNQLVYGFNEINLFNQNLNTAIIQT